MSTGLFSVTRPVLTRQIPTRPDPDPTRPDQLMMTPKLNFQNINILYVCCTAQCGMHNWGPQTQFWGLSLRLLIFTRVKNTCTLSVTDISSLFAKDQRNEK